MAGQRTNYLSWDEYFMALASLTALRGKDFGKGACIVDNEHRILSVGYEEVPYSILQMEMSDFSSFALDPLSSAFYTFQGRRQELENGIAYLSSFPNYEESRHIAQARLRKVVYLTKNIPKDVESISKTILDCAGVELVSYYDSYTLEEYVYFLKNLKQVLRRYIGKVDNGPLLPSEYFMSVALLSALRSKDPSTQVGACLASKQNSILSIAYNGTPYKMHDDILPWHSFGEKDGNLVQIKNPYIIHAEMNAFDNYRGNLSDLHHATLYVLYSPCCNCSKRISQSGIDRVVYLREYKKNDESKKSYRWLSRAGVVTSLYNDYHDYTKEECINLIDDTTKVIQKSLKK